MSDTPRFSEEEQQTMRETALEAIGAAPKKSKPSLKNMEWGLPIGVAVDDYQSKKGFMRKRLFASSGRRIVLQKKESSLVRLSKVLCVCSIVIGCIVIVLAVHVLMNPTP